MPLIFANGGTPGGSIPNHYGLSFNSNTSLLTQIRDNLVSAGWTVQTDSITASNLLLMRGQTTNSHLCFVEFSCIVNSLNSNQNFLRVRGLHTATTIQSPYLNFPWLPGETNYFYLTADQDSGAMVILPSDLTLSTGLHFGFYDRFDQGDQYAWGIGDLTLTEVNKYVARNQIGATNWKQFSTFFQNSDFSSAAYQNSCELMMDSLTTLLKPYSNFESIAGNYNAGFQAYRGNLNFNNWAILTQPVYKEGRETISSYSNSGQVPPKLAARGVVKHVWTGMASVAPGTILNAANGQKFVTAALQSQGIRIL